LHLNHNSSKKQADFPSHTGPNIRTQEQQVLNTCPWRRRPESLVTNPLENPSTLPRRRADSAQDVRTQTGTAATASTTRSAVEGQATAHRHRGHVRGRKRGDPDLQRHGLAPGGRWRSAAVAAVGADPATRRASGVERRGTRRLELRRRRSKAAAAAAE